MNAYASLNTYFPSWDTFQFNDPFPWAIVGYAAAVMGDADRANQYRQSVEAKYVNGRSVRDLATSWCVSEKAAESQLSRARKAFRVTFLALSRNLQRLGDFAASVLGPKVVADTGEWGTYSWTSVLLGAPGYRLGGGTDEIMKNILAERVLGLPR